MCGIAGFFTSSNTSPSADAVIARMSATLFHRGPDDSGEWIDPSRGIAFGHRRLSIVDLSPAGHQPMTSACGRYVAAYNGEIYNFLELKAELEQRGASPWRGHSDTEVMLACFSAWGIEASIPRLNGMFACAVFDKQEDALYLIRDRFGKKPLYYGYAGGNFLFASELKALRSFPDFSPGLDRDALALFIRHNYIPSPRSIYRNIFKLLPGAYLRITKAHLKTRELPIPVGYWDAREIARRGLASPLSIPEPEAVDRLESLLKNAVKLRMIADVPLGVFLSGGIDSSLVTALMQRQSGRPVKSFSIGFFDKKYDEAVHARAVAAHLGTDHTELYLDASHALAVIPALPHIFDEPFADSSQIPTYLISRITRSHVTVALSGDGGDEVFGGYSRYPAAAGLWKRLRHIPLSARKALGILLRRLPAAALNASALQKFLPVKALGDKILRVADSLPARRALEFYLAAFMSHCPAEAVPVLGASAADHRFSGFFREDAPHPLVAQMMYTDAISYLPDDILVKVDRASMAVSLEMRAPLLDYRVYELAWRLPLAMKIRNGSGKRILRTLLARAIPQALIDRPKKGFSVPLAGWLRGPLKPWAEELVSPRRIRNEGYLNPAAIAGLWRGFITGKRHSSGLLWNILMFQAWLESVKKNHAA